MRFKASLTNAYNHFLASKACRGEECDPHGDWSWTKGKS